MLDKSRGQKKRYTCVWTLQPVEWGGEGVGVWMLWLVDMGKMLEEGIAHSGKSKEHSKQGNQVSQRL